MKPSNLLRPTLFLVVLLCLMAACDPPPPPPVINSFEVRPANVCPGGRIEIEWNTDAATTILSSTRTGVMPAVSNRALIGDTLTATTTYTITAKRGSHPDQVRSGTATVITGETSQVFTFAPDCTSGTPVFRNAGLAPTEFDPNVRVVRLSNNSPYRVTVTHQGATSAYGPGETVPFANVPLIGDWTLAVELPSGEGCPASGGINPGPQPQSPRSVSIVAAAGCR